MKKRIGFTALFLLAIIMLQSAHAIKPYPIDHSDVVKIKDILDDPRPLYTDSKNYKIWIPDEAWEKVTFDPEEMKKVWSECVGFRAPDVVGNAYPEIKPGKYTLEDKTTLPFEKLMSAWELSRWNRPGDGYSNHVGYYTEMEIVPTRQYYKALPVARASLQHMGKTKQDEDGYILDSTYEGGYPFPRPCGPHKGIQIVYNFERRYTYGEDCLQVDMTIGVDKNWKNDHKGIGVSKFLRTKGRVWMPPFGVLDKRAERQSELRNLVYTISSPRDFFGNVYAMVYYTDPQKPNMVLAYVNMLRRIRKLSSSDKQDQAVGQDIAFDDAYGWSQAISPVHYPFEYRVLAERELLVPACTTDGAEWLDSKDKYRWKNARFERRPCWVVECRQLDKNYIYSRRVITVDKETLLIHYHEMYDQKDRLYRNLSILWGFIEPMGVHNAFFAFSNDFIDVHSTLSYVPGIPAIWMDRGETSLRNLMKAK